MEIQLKELIDKIKNEGVKTAEEKSNEIIKAAQAKAENIVSDARKNADSIIQKGKAEVDKYKNASDLALKQASRDLLLNLKGKLKDIFSSVVETETNSALSSEVLERAIIELIRSWDKEELKDLNILISEKLLKEVEVSLKNKLAEEIKSGLEIKPFNNIDAGFRVSEKDGSAYYDFTDKGIAEILSQYLNPKLNEILNKSIEE